MDGWRVDGRDSGGANAREGFDCPVGDRTNVQTWYMGSTRPIGEVSEEDREFFTILDRWAHDLYNRGYVGQQGQRLIFDGTTHRNGDLNPGAGDIRRLTPNDRNRITGDPDPYRINFIIENGQPVLGPPAPPGV